VRPDGAVAARYPLPVLEPDPNALLAQPGQAAGAGTRAAGRGRVAALLAVHGDVLAVTATPFAAAITDLRTGARVSLGSYTRIVASTVGGDGFVYLLAGSADPAFTLRFLRIDPRTMRSLAAWDTGVAASSQTAWALPTRFGAIVYSPGTPHSIDAYSGPTSGSSTAAAHARTRPCRRTQACAWVRARATVCCSTARPPAAPCRGSTPTTASSAGRVPDSRHRRARPSCSPRTRRATKSRMSERRRRSRLSD